MCCGSFYLKIYKQKRSGQKFPTSKQFFAQLDVLLVYYESSSSLRYYCIRFFYSIFYFLCLSGSQTKLAMKLKANVSKPTTIDSSRAIKRGVTMIYLDFFSLEVQLLRHLSDQIQLECDGRLLPHPRHSSF